MVGGGERDCHDGDSGKGIGDCAHLEEAARLTITHLTGAHLSGERCSGEASSLSLTSIASSTGDKEVRVHMCNSDDGGGGTSSE